MDRHAREWLGAGSHFEWVPTEPLRHAGKLNIFHAEFGDSEAPLLLMVHGFPTSSIDWQDVAGELSANYRVLRSRPARLWILGQAHGRELYPAP